MESKIKALNQDIKDGMRFLYTNQLPYGEFRTWNYPDRNLTESRSYFSSIYITTFVLYSIRFIADELKDEITRKGIKFILEEMESPGMWRFTTTNRSAVIQGGKIHVYTPFSIYPDLDDTACASFCLKQNNALPATHSNLPLFFNNRDEQGLFYTWLLDEPPYRKSGKGLKQLKSDGNDICPGISCNILLYLGDTKETAALSSYLLKLAIIQENDAGSRYFSNKYVFFYLYSRAFYNGAISLAGGCDAILEQIIPFQNEDGSFGSPMETALAICTLLNLGSIIKEISPAVEYIHKTRSIDGSWPLDSFFLEPYGGSHFGSAEFTTAICLEALSRFLLNH